MDMYGRAPNPDSGLEGPMRRLGLGSGGDVQYPERPGEQDCAYYMRTGTCSYGDKCRYNHPRDHGSLTGAGKTGAVDYPERVGQPVCKHYMRTGNCRFGSTCKYHHPKQGGGSTQPVSLNSSGYPLRPGEKECAFYIKTGECKFGSTCKFHHPQPAGTTVPAPAPEFFPTVQQLSFPSHHPYPPYANWPVARPPGSYMQVSYPPMLISPGVAPVQSWNPYVGPVNSVVSSSGQQSVQVGPVYGSPNQASSTKPTLSGPGTASLSLVGPSRTKQTENKFPERPGQPECDFYMRTGDCKFGAMCKYHHPPDWSTPRTNVVLNALGLPLRPYMNYQSAVGSTILHATQVGAVNAQSVKCEGAQPCSYYMQRGLCKFGQTCKFDHPIMSYSSSAPPLSDMPIAPYSIGFSVASFTPSSSSTEIQPEFISNKEHFSSRMTSKN